MTTYSYDSAIRVLSDIEKNRIVACFLSAENPYSTVADWDVATASYKSASAESMKVSLRNVLKKIEKATCEDGGALDTSAASTPPTAKRGGKRKSAADGDATTPAKASAKKARKTPVKAEAIDEDGPSDADVGDAMAATI